MSETKKQTHEYLSCICGFDRSYTTQMREVDVIVPFDVGVARRPTYYIP